MKVELYLANDDTPKTIQRAQIDWKNRVVTYKNSDSCLGFIPFEQIRKLEILNPKGYKKEGRIR